MAGLCSRFFSLQKRKLNVHYWICSVQRTAPITMWKGRHSVYGFLDSVNEFRTLRKNFERLATLISMYFFHYMINEATILMH